MTETDILYLSISFAGLLSLTAVLRLIGRAASDCPQIGGAARVSALVVMTGFLAIGTGIILLFGAILPELGGNTVQVLYLAVGFCALSLGLGFYAAATMLRDIVQSAPKPDMPQFS